ncbi:MAG: D-alanyl-D-alanine carboxypeptidase/D-alanyl-D-alanine-endopeptidase [Pseudomonadota bacterium]|nr:D-alanyl-D-alanine carboxypeptidase/D-alanyl-D-alanine-endopeptidase [Pseudomonadota bacterium]
MTPAAATSVVATTTPLTNRIDAFIAQPRFAHADWGIDVVSLDNGKTLYAHAADKLFVPASNAKLYIVALALDTLGAYARITTSLYATTASGADGTLAGDLILYGRGDPSLGGPETSPDCANRFAAALAARGIRRVDGDLVADDTFFQGPSIGSGWEANDLQSWFAPPASALSVHGNVLQVRVARDGVRCCEVAVDPPDSGMQIVNQTANAATNDEDALGLYRAPGADTLYVYGALPSGVTTKTYVVSAPDPALLAGNLLRDALKQHGIALDGHVRVVHWPQADSAVTTPGTVTLAVIASPPLRDLIRHMLKYSDNLYAQTLLLQVGAHAAQRGICADRATPPRSSEGWGACALRAMLARAGIAPEDATFEEGSGMSRKDLVTPAATVRLLAWIARQSFASVLNDALPVAGVDGTLAHRLLGTFADNNLRAKTGTLTHVYALSGYLTNARGEHLAFSLMLDRYQRPTDTLGRTVAPSPTDDLDAITVMLAGSSP